MKFIRSSLLFLSLFFIVKAEAPLATVSYTNSFHYVLREFQQITLNKGAKLYTNDILFTSEGQIHLKMKKMELRVGPNSQLSLNLQHDVPKYYLRKGHVEFRIPNHREDFLYIAENKIARYKGLGRHLHMEATNLHSIFTLIEGFGKVFALDSMGQISEDMPIHKKTQVYIEQLKFPEPYRPLSGLEIAYYKEYFELKKEKTHLGPTDLDTGVSYMPIDELQKKILQQRIAKEQSQLKDESFFKQHQEQLNSVQQQAKESIREATRQDDFFRFPIPLPSPVSTQ